MKKLFITSLFLSLLCIASFGQLTQKKIIQGKASVKTVPAVTASPVVKTTTATKVVPVAKPNVALKTDKQIVFLNTHNSVYKQKILNPALAKITANHAIKMFEYTKDLRYSDGSVVHLRLTKSPSVTGQTANLKVNAKQTGEDQDAGYNCITSNVSLTATSTDFINNDYSRQTAHIFPGAIYTYNHLYDGSFREETANRNPIIIGSSSTNMSSPTFEEVQTPNQANIHNALAKLFSRFHGDAANESMAYLVFESANNSDLNIKVGAGGSGYGFSFSNVFNTQDKEKHLYMTIDARKSLFTISVAAPDSGYFKTPVNGSSPMVIMGSVSYGVRVLANMEFTFLSKTDADNFKAQYSGFGFNANVSLDFLSKNTVPQPM